MGFEGLHAVQWLLCQGLVAAWSRSAMLIYCSSTLQSDERPKQRLYQAFGCWTTPELHRILSEL